MGNGIKIIKGEKQNRCVIRNLGSVGEGETTPQSQRMNIAARGKAVTSLPETEERRPIGHRETPEKEASAQ